jgi:hypothetical protein
MVHREKNPRWVLTKKNCRRIWYPSILSLSLPLTPFCAKSKALIFSKIKVYWDFFFVFFNSLKLPFIRSPLYSISSHFFTTKNGDLFGSSFRQPFINIFHSPMQKKSWRAFYKQTPLSHKRFFFDALLLFCNAWECVT